MRVAVGPTAPAEGGGYTGVDPVPISVRKGHIITTATAEKRVHPAHDLFSHPYVEQPANHGDRPTGQRISREDLFREPGDPAPAALAGMRSASPADTTD